MFNGRRRHALAVACLLAFPAAAAAQGPEAAAPSALQLGIDTTAFDRSVRPQDDFFRFVNGGWLDRTAIPGDRSRWGSFDELGEESQTAVRAVIEAAASSRARPGSEERKIGDLYNAFMDSVRIEQLGITPLRAELTRIDRLQSRAALPALLAQLARIRVGGPFGVRVGQDDKHSDRYIVSVSQSGLTLPDRDYYLRDDARFAKIRGEYRGYVEKLLTLAGRPDPAGAAERIVALETALARPQWDRVRSRNADSTYNRMTVVQLHALAPSFDWAGYLRAAGLGKATDVVVRQPSYLGGLDSILAATPVETWRDYLAFRLLNGYAGELPSAFVQAQFDFFSRTLAGQEEMTPRWKHGVRAVDGAMGEAVGKLYVARYFKPAAKARMDTLVHNLLAAFKVGIDSLEWMSPATKAQAQEKLAHFHVKIGYPDKWRDYSKLQVRAGDLIGNTMRSAEFGYDEMIGHLGKPVDRARWGMTPQTVNASYSPTNNEITFPAAILQPPFFNVNADDAVNYGAIGAVIGHEISHGFDDQGRKSDGDGNLRDWWTAEDAAAFQLRADKLADEYSSYSPVDTMHINGHLTLGENIGDLSGLAVALRAYHISLHGTPAPVIGGFTGDQRFFLAIAQVWRTKTRPAALRRSLLTDPHAPGEYRGFVPLTNMDAFYAAFDIKPGDKLYRAPEDRVRLW